MRHPRSTPARGQGSLRIGQSAGASVVLGAQAREPLKWLVPRHRGPAAWVYASSFGGGLVAGDRLDLRLELRSSARCFLGTQASTKIFHRQGALGAAQSLQAQLAADSLLISLPDPVTCFAEADYLQEQVFHCQAGASLVALDCCSAGRSANGEHWAMQRYASRTDLVYDGRQRLSDRLLLADQPGCRIAERCAAASILANLLLAGPATEGLRRQLAADLTEPLSLDAGIIESFSPIDADCAIWRLAGDSVASAQQHIFARLDDFDELLGGRPWRRRA